MRQLSWQSRWNSLFLRLNQIEARADDMDRVYMARFILERVSERIPRHIVLRPHGRGEPGPPCRECDGVLHSGEVLVACTVCLEAAHPECWQRSGGCPHPACVAESLPVRQLRVS